MKKETEEQKPVLPDLEIIDLEEEESLEDLEDFGEPYGGDTAQGQGHPKKRPLRISIHIVLLAVFIIFVCGILYKVMNFGEYVDQEEIFKDGPGSYDNTMDVILPLLDAEGNRLETNYDDGLTIVAFGNAPFADDRDSEDNLANMIAEMTGATVYNCSISDSYLAAQWPSINTDQFPMDLYTLYWLSMISTGWDLSTAYNLARESLGENLPPEADEVVHTLTTLDFNTVDVIVIMYDATDYLRGHGMYSDLNPTDIEQFTGNLEAGIGMFQSVYPHIRIIVLSPPYAYSDKLDENGDYISSDIARYGQDVLSTYAIKEYTSCMERSVSFVDNLYGTITEDNAKEYLIDNLHLNVAGRRAIAERFVYALNYYNQTQSQD